jgi:hypothetical protein
MRVRVYYLIIRVKQEELLSHMIDISPGHFFNFLEEWRVLTFLSFLKTESRVNNII